MNHVIRYNYVHKQRLRAGNLVLDTKTEAEARKLAHETLAKEHTVYEITSIQHFGKGIQP